MGEFVVQKKKKPKLLARLSRRLGKESRLIPDLIYQIETFERTILAISNTYGITIVKSFRRSTARDFRIQVDELENILILNPSTDPSEAEEDQHTDNSSFTVIGPEDTSLVISTAQ